MRGDTEYEFVTPHLLRGPSKIQFFKTIVVPDIGLVKNFFVIRLRHARGCKAKDYDNKMNS